jgi:hypothetical protein
MVMQEENLKIFKIFLIFFLKKAEDKNQRKRRKKKRKPFNFLLPFYTNKIILFF